MGNFVRIFDLSLPKDTHRGDTTMSLRPCFYRIRHSTEYVEKCPVVPETGLEAIAMASFEAPVGSSWGPNEQKRLAEINSLASAMTLANLQYCRSFDGHS